MSPESARHRRDFVLAAAAELGFARAGVARLTPPRRYPALLRWLEEGRHGEMAFMDSPAHRQGRADYEAILPGARSAVVAIAAYDARAPEPDAARGIVAGYARGRDYHRVVKDKLEALGAGLLEMVGSSERVRVCVDTAPVLERELAEAAGLGFVGKNTMLISPGVGSFTVVGELFTTAEIEGSPDPDLGERCGSCRACLDACPTGALPDPYVLDSRRCISYLTIEHRSPIARDLRAAIGTRVYGCDVCQDVCPYNRKAPHRTPVMTELAAEPGRATPSLADWLTLSSSGYRRLVKGSAMSRARRSMLRRNAAIAIGNAGGDPAILIPCLRDPDAMVRGAAAWALGQLGARAELEGALEGESDPEVVAELRAALSPVTPSSSET